MKTRWVVVAGRAGARFLAFKGPGRGLALEDTLEHEAGRLKAGEIDTDRPGRSFDSGGEGRHAMSRANDPTEQLAAAFARTVADRLRDARVAGRLDSIVLVAEPGFLGLLRGALDGPTANCVEATLARDLTQVEAGELDSHLGAVLPTAAPSA